MTEQSYVATLCGIVTLRQSEAVGQVQKALSLVRGFHLRFGAVVALGSTRQFPRDNAASLSAHIKLGIAAAAEFTHDGIAYVVVACVSDQFQRRPQRP